MAAEASTMPCQLHWGVPHKPMSQWRIWLPPNPLRHGLDGQVLGHGLAPIFRASPLLPLSGKKKCIIKRIG